MLPCSPSISCAFSGGTQLRDKTLFVFLFLFASENTHPLFQIKGLHHISSVIEPKDHLIAEIQALLLVSCLVIELGQLIGPALRKFLLLIFLKIRICSFRDAFFALAILYFSIYWLLSLPATSLYSSKNSVASLICPIFREPRSDGKVCSCRSALCGRQEEKFPCSLHSACWRVDLAHYTKVRTFFTRRQSMLSTICMAPL